MKSSNNGNGNKKLVEAAAHPRRKSRVRIDNTNTVEFCARKGKVMDKCMREKERMIERARSERDPVHLKEEH
jgi:hypothetical protein